MSRDNKKGRPRGARQLARRAPIRAPYDKVLIVCEGSKTEPFYFDELIKFHKISTANVKVDGSCGSSPKSIVEYALELYEHEKSIGDSFDRVFCVFDRDTHDTYEWALQFVTNTEARIRKEKQDSGRTAEPPAFCAITSVPCFEFWLLLHHVFTTKPYLKTGRKGCSDEVIADLRRYIKDYKKAQKGTFLRHLNLLDTAKNNALRANENARMVGTNNPTTYIYELVTYLEQIKHQ